jgi:hypothetical protein
LSCFWAQTPHTIKNPRFYSPKFNQAGVDYELGIPCSDEWPISSWRPWHQCFLQQRPQSQAPTGKKVIGDNGYHGEDAIISTPNAHDPANIWKFKSGAWSRNESFNARLKVFWCLDVGFRHGIEKYRFAFEAVCVICQYQLENGSPLFDV